MKRFQSLVMTLGIMLGVLTAGLAVAQPVGAINVFPNKGCTDGRICKGDNIGPLVKNLVNLLLFILGIIAVIMIIVGGIKYTTSEGDPSKAKSAKDTILYSIVGLIVAMLAYAIVNFVVAQF